MNYMTQIAQMLGVELEEEFELKKGIDDLYRFKLSRIGLVYFSPSTQMWHEGNRLLVDLLLGKDEIIKIPEPILDEVEKEYLSAVIKPFRNKIEYIDKYIDENGEYISLIYRELSDRTFAIGFPSFKKGTMYKGMEIGKRYTLEELGL